MILTIEESGLPSSFETDQGLVNTFNGQKASPEQCHDMLKFRNIGEESSKNYIQKQLLGSSNITIHHRKNLLTMSVKPKRKRENQREREAD